MGGSAELETHHVKRRLRVLAILAGAERAGLAPLPAPQLHTIAYFADALAPVWGLQILDAQLLKRSSGPLSPLLQDDVDALVGRGIVEPSGVRHVRDSDSTWRLDARYQLNWEMARPILDLARSFPVENATIELTEEVVLAVSALDTDRLPAASRTDVAYGDVLVDDGGVINIETRDGKANPTARVALRFGSLLQSDVHLTPAEMVHMYVRQLDKQLRRVA